MRVHSYHCSEILGSGRRKPQKCAHVLPRPSSIRDLALIMPPHMAFELTGLLAISPPYLKSVSRAIELRAMPTRTETIKTYTCTYAPHHMTRKKFQRDTISPRSRLLSPPPPLLPSGLSALELRRLLGGVNVEGGAA